MHLSLPCRSVLPSSDGEDLLTPLVQRAAEAIADAASEPAEGKTK
jgi:hypothetical protein